MSGYEYQVVPAPAKGVKAKGVKSAEGRFAFALQEVMNQMGAEGWEYQRAETLPSTERTGLTGSSTQWRHVLVFRRALAAHEPATEDAPVQEPMAALPPPAPAPAPEPAPVAVAEPTPEAMPAPEPEPEPQPAHAEAPVPEEKTVIGDLPDIDPARPAGQPGATQMLRDNGVEEVSDVSGLSNSLETLAKSRKSPFDTDG